MCVCSKYSINFFISLGGNYVHWSSSFNVMLFFIKY